MKCITTSIIIILILSFFPSLHVNTATFTDTRTLSVLPVHNLDTNISYATIQEAIDDNATTDGHTILVDTGTYSGDIVVNKSIRLSGANRTSTVIEGLGGRRFEEVVRIEASNATFNGFTVCNGARAVSITPEPRETAISGVNVSDNSLINSTIGLSVAEGHGCYIDNNEMADDEIGFSGFSFNFLTNNTVVRNFFGMVSSPECEMRNNTLASNTYNLVLEPPFFEGMPYDWETYYYGSVGIDTSNTVNDKPICIFHNQSDLLIDPLTFPEIGYLGLISVSNVTVRNLNLSDNGEGVFILNSPNTSIEGCTFKSNLQGIYMFSNGTALKSNIIQENIQGIFSQGYNNCIHANTITNNTVRLFPYRFPDKWPYWPYLFSTDFEQIMWLSSGLALYGGGNTTLLDNNFEDNEQGVLLYQTRYNLFRNNSISGSIYNLAVDRHLFPAVWTIDPPCEPQISPYLWQDIDGSNTVDGKPVYWWINAINTQVPEDAGYVVLINATQVTVENLILQNSTQGILLVDAKNVTVMHNIIRNARYGILSIGPGPLSECGDNAFTMNNVTDSGIGIYFLQPRSEISSNYLSHDLCGIFDDGNGNSIMSNVITDNSYPSMEEWILGYLPLHYTSLGIYGGAVGMIVGSSNGTIYGNTISYNEVGMSAGYPYSYANNTIFHNNFINNDYHTLNPQTDLTMNSWDAGYPVGGNYWSGFATVDAFGGIYQNETGSDGIADNARQIIWNKTDYYPLMAPVTTFEVETQNNTFIDVDIISNSTVSNFQLDYTSKALKFTVFGEYGRGFCRLDIPSQILDEFFQGNYTVLVDGNPVEFRNWTDETHTYIYFTYRHSEHEITIVPEYQLLAQFLLAMIAVTFSAITKEKLWKKQVQSI